MAMFHTSLRQDGVEVLKCLPEDIRLLKVTVALENVNRRRSTSRKFQTGILSKNYKTCEWSKNFML